MTNFRPSWFTTWQEMDEADSVDLEKLRDGLEARTTCCYELVPTDCMTADCGHGHHEIQDPLTGEPLCPHGSDLPCTEYAPDTALMYHRDCQNRRSYHEAVTKAREQGGPRSED